MSIAGTLRKMDKKTPKKTQMDFQKDQEVADKASDQVLLELAVDIKERYEKEEGVNKCETDEALPFLVLSFKTAADNLVHCLSDWKRIVERRSNRSQAGLALNSSYASIAHTQIEALQSLASAIDHLVDPEIERALKNQRMGAALKAKHDSMKQFADASMQRRGPES